MQAVAVGKHITLLLPNDFVVGPYSPISEDRCRRARRRDCVSVAVYDLPASGNLFSIAPDGTGLKQLTRCKAFCWDGQYSPDGTRIAFIYDGQVATMSANGANMKMVTSAADPQPHWPSWSPGGKHLAYERYAVSQHDIWVVDLASGATTPVVTSRVDDTTPSWSR